MHDELLNALDDCLNALAAGVSVEAALQRYPHFAEALRPMLEAARASQTPGLAPVPPHAQMKSRAAYLGRAAKLREAKARRGWDWLAQPRRLASAGAVIIVMLLIGVYGAVSAAAQSLPGDALYPVKRAAENVQLLLAVEPTARANLKNEFDARRDQETEAVLNTGREASVEFRGVLSAQEGTFWMVGGVRVQITAATRVDGIVTIGQTLRVEGRTRSDGTVQAARIRVIDSLPTPTVRATESARPSATPTPASRRSPEAAETAEPTEAHADDTETPEATPTEELEATRPATKTHAPSRTPEPSHTPEPTRTLDPSRTPEPSHTAELSRTSEPSRTPEPSQTQRPEEIEFEGQVQSIEGGIWMIEGRAVKVTGETELRGDLHVGSLVRVRALEYPDGRLLALRIEAR